MKILRATLALLVIIGNCHIQGLAPQSGSADVAVIVNPSNAIASISSADLRSIFAGEKIGWTGSLLVVPFVRTQNARERDILLNSIMRMSEEEYRNYWMRKIYSGASSREPLALYSNGMLLEAIRSEKGGIALINAADVKAGVKVIKVNGFLPGTPSYPLR